MKPTLTLIIALLISIGCFTYCTKPYQMSKCYWVYASYQDSENPDSLIKQLFVVDYTFCCEAKNYTDTILCSKLWVKKTGTIKTIRYYSDSITSFTLLKDWKALDYQTY